MADKNDLAFQELLQRHPVSDPPSCSAPKTASLVVDESAVLICLKGFPRGTGTSPGASGLWAQHLLDAVSGHTAPSAELCLTTLTHLMNFLLSGKASPSLAPWLCGAPLTALLKKNGVFALLQLVKFFVALPVVCAVSLLVPFSQTFSYLMVKWVLVSQVVWRQLSMLSVILFPNLAMMNL